MSSYRNNAHPVRAASSFEEKMRAMLERKIRRGTDGIDLNEDKKGHSPFIVHRRHSMDDDVFDLGCRMHGRFPSMSHEVWVHWMTDAAVRDSGDRVVVEHRDRFFCDYAAKNLGKLLAEFFEKPIDFVPNPAIKRSVEV